MARAPVPGFAVNAVPTTGVKIFFLISGCLVEPPCLRFKPGRAASPRAGRLADGISPAAGGIALAH